jgi:hypothetical protein
MDRIEKLQERGLTKSQVEKITCVHGLFGILAASRNDKKLQIIWFQSAVRERSLMSWMLEDYGS